MKYQTYTVIGFTEDGQICADVVKATCAHTAFRKVARMRTKAGDSYDLVFCTLGDTSEEHFPGESMTDACEYLEIE